MTRIVRKLPDCALLLLLVGCGGAPTVAPPMTVAAQCQSQTGLTVQLESVPAGTVDLCAWSATMVDGLRAEYEARWGALSMDGWTVRIRTSADFSGDHLGSTWPDSRTIDLVDGKWIVLPHEFNHVRMGSGHAGWCTAFEPWEEATLGLNERAYLGCQ